MTHFLCCQQPGRQISRKEGRLLEGLPRSLVPRLAAPPCATCQSLQQSSSLPQLCSHVMHSQCPRGSCCSLKHGVVTPSTWLKGTLCVAGTQRFDILYGQELWLGRFLPALQHKKHLLTASRCAPKQHLLTASRFAPSHRGDAVPHNLRGSPDPPSFLPGTSVT